MACEFCSSESGPNVDTAGELTFEEIGSKLLPLLLESNPKNLILSGGEPLTRKDILDIIELFSTNLPECNLVLQTNGLLLNSDILSAIKGKIKYIELSVEDMFYSKSLCRKLTEVFEVIKKANIPMQFSYVISRDNMKYIKEVIKLVERYDTPILLRFVSPIGNAANKKIQFMYQEDIKRFYLEMIDYIIDNKCINENVLNIVLSPLQVTDSCGAYGKMIYMDSKGGLALCSGLNFSPYVIGNVREKMENKYRQKMSNILVNDDVEKRLLVDKMERCKECDVKYFCCGVCAAKTYNTSNEEILYADCRIKKILVYFWLFDFKQNTDMLENLLILKERIIDEYDQ